MAAFKFNLKDEIGLCQLDEHLKKKVFTLYSAPEAHISRINDLYKLCKSVTLRSALLFKLSEKSKDTQFIELTEGLIKDIGEIPRVFPPSEDLIYLILKSDFGKLYLVYKNLITSPEISLTVTYIKKVFEVSRMASASETTEVSPDDILREINQILDTGGNLIEDFPKLYKVQELLEILAKVGTANHASEYLKKVLSSVDKIKTTDDLMVFSMLILPMLKLSGKKDLIQVEILIMYYILSQKERDYYSDNTLLMLASGLVQSIVNIYGTSIKLVEGINLLDLFSTLTYLRIYKGVCASCGVSESDDETVIKTCTQCKCSKYCSDKCHRSDWKTHKSWCGKVEPITWITPITDKYKLDLEDLIKKITLIKNEW